MDVVVADAVGKKFGGRQALSNVSLRVMQNEVVTIIGPSGAGKTTLLKIIAGLETPDSGSVRVEGSAAMVMQEANLWPHKTVIENVMLALVEAKGMGNDAARSAARKSVAQMHLSRLEEAFPESLSGGERQRVAIARALALEPSVLLLDEITSSLDPLLVREVADSILDLACQDRTMLVVTHQLDFARKISDRIIFLKGGRVVEEGHPYKILANPQKSETREFVLREVIS